MSKFFIQLSLGSIESCDNYFLLEVITHKENSFQTMRTKVLKLIGILCETKGNLLVVWLHSYKFNRNIDYSNTDYREWEHRTEDISSAKLYTIHHSFNRTLLTNCERKSTSDCCLIDYKTCMCTFSSNLNVTRVNREMRSINGCDRSSKFILSKILSKNSYFFDVSLNIFGLYPTPWSSLSWISRN